MPPLSVLAPAKVNLFLHVGPIDRTNYHPIFSLMSFADIGDQVGLHPDEAFGFEAGGEFGRLTGPSKDNLMVRAALAFFEVIQTAPRGRLTLDKQLPVAAGLGGGSSDAAAALRLLRHAYAPDLPDERLYAIAAALGADGAACLAAQPVLASGRGERISPAPAWPQLAAVLVNPGLPSPTGAVYRAYDHGRMGDAAAFDVPSCKKPHRAAEWLANETRNDLQPPAIRLTHAIGESLQVLKSAPGVLLARMSGSGATSFALCADFDQAQHLAAGLARAYPRWWVRPCWLGGPWA